MVQEAIMITQDQVKHLFQYNDGSLYWKNPTSLKIKPGDLAGGKHNSGYLMIKINCKRYFVHRLVFLYHRGFLPSQIDHIDGDVHNNRIENLRECNNQQNSQNRKLSNISMSGVKGVSWDKRKRKWTVSITVGNTKFRKQFDDFDLAELVAIEVRDKYHKEFARYV
jgi:hypothetical protein